MHAIEKSQATEISRRPIFLMWVDGVLDTERLQTLSKQDNIATIEQYDNYVIATFSHYPRRQSYRFLDPHRFVVQINKECTELEINFNPSAKEVQKLREFYHRLETVKIHNQKLMIR
jgi:hypothetical protein